MTRPTTTEPPDGAVMTCPSCSYSLEGLPELSFSHPCPECGYPASQYAPAEEWLRHADPRWLRRILLGLRVSVFSAQYLIALVCVSIAGVLLAELLGLLADLSILSLDADAWFDRLVWIATLVGAAIHATSCVLLSASPGRGYLPPVRARRLVRWCGTLFAPLILAVFSLPFLVDEVPAWILQPLDAAVLLNSVLYLAAQPVWLLALEWRTDSWSPTAPQRYRYARRALLWMLGVAVVLKAYWLWRFGPGSSEDPSPPLVWVFMLIAFTIMTEQVTKPARTAVRAELSRASPAPGPLSMSPPRD